jgi:serine/threonine protein kinase/tetratricopeptide (TPR) repeat protein
MKGDAQAILAVAADIADGRDTNHIDWEQLESGATSDAERKLVRSLRLIASIGEIHRSTDADEEPDNATAFLMHRARVVGRIGPSTTSTFGKATGSPSSRPAEEQIGNGARDSGGAEGRVRDDRESGLLARQADTRAVRTTPEQGSPQNIPLAPGGGEGAGGEGASARWGHLLLRERVGSGVFGDVYRAYDEKLDRDVALKLLRTGTRSADRLAAKVLHEGRLLARVRHPNVVSVYGVEAHGDRVGLWMEFIRGCTLEQLLERQGLFGAREATLIGQDLCRALAAVHAAGLVHRDVKAQNVMREEGGRVVLMDFGTGIPVREDDANAGETGASSTSVAAPTAGTPLYLAPEVLDGKDATPTSDIYSLGVLLFHLVTNSYPVTAKSFVELIESHRGGRKRLHDARPDLPDAFVQVVERSLAFDPAQRYASAGAMQEAMTRALGLEAVSSGDFGSSAAATADSVAGEQARSHSQAYEPQRERAYESSYGRGYEQPHGGAREQASPLPAPAHSWLASPGSKWMLATAAAVVVLVAIIAAAAMWRMPTRASLEAAPGPINSLVLLPFANISSADKDLADGIMLLIGDRLSALPGLRVLRYTQATAIRDRGLSVAEILRRQQTDAAIEGSVTWSGARALVFVQLRRAGSDTPLWMQQFDVPVTRAATLPNDVARAVASRLAVNLSAADQGQLAQSDAPEPAAFEAYLRGLVQLRLGTIPAVRQAIQHFQRALQLDPNHAPSLAALSSAYILQTTSQRVLPRHEGAALARDAAERALQLDDRLPEAYRALAEIKFYVDWDWAGAESAYRKAIEYNGNSGDLRERYAMFLAARRRLPDAMQQMQQAVALDPMSSLSNAALGMLWHYARSNDQAERILRGVLERDPSSLEARFGLVRVLIDMQRTDEALQELERLKADANGQLRPAQQAAVGLAYAAIGRKADATGIAEELLEKDQADGPSVDAASVFLALGERDRALEILEPAVDQKQPKVLFLSLDPRFKTLRADPRFATLLRRLGLPA